MKSLNKTLKVGLLLLIGISGGYSHGLGNTELVGDLNLGKHLQLMSAGGILTKHGTLDEGKVSNDTTARHNFICLQLMESLTIFNIGYGYQFRAAKKISFQPSIGLGYVPYSGSDLPLFTFATQLKCRILYNFTRRHSAFVGVGIDYNLDPWYVADSTKYYADCGKGICPEPYFNALFETGHQYKWRRFLLSSTISCNYYYLNTFWPWFGFDIKYLF